MSALLAIAGAPASGHPLAPAFLGARPLDWAQTPLGSPSSWNEQLRSAVEGIVTAAEPCCLAWGASAALVYNDAFRALLGPGLPLERYGQPAPRDPGGVWSLIEPLFEEVRATRTVAFRAHAVLVLSRAGRREERSYSVSASPVRDAAGEIAGIRAVVHDTTRQLLSERRLRCLGELAARIGVAADLDEVGAAAVAALATDRADVPFALVYQIEPGGRRARLRGAGGLSADERLAPRAIDLAVDAAPGTWPIASVLERRRFERVEDLAAGFEPARSALVLPLKIPGREAAGVLIAGLSPVRLLDDDYVAFLSLSAGLIGQALAARAGRSQVIPIRGVEAEALIREQAARAEAEAANRAKDEFLANVSHQLRTPLNAMLGWVHLLGRGTLDAEVSTRAVRSIERNTRLLARHIEALIDLSSAITGKLCLEVQAVDLAPVVIAVRDAVRPAVCARAQRLHVIVDPCLGPVSGDRDRLQQIVWNLVSNAVKFGDQGGLIEVRLERSQTHARLVVRDDGPGVDPEILPHLFERYPGVAGGPGRQDGGLGLGLAVVRHLVELHGGQVRVESRAGQGSAFVVELPLLAVETPTADLPLSVASPALSGARVLLIEDDLDLSARVAAVMGPLGAEVRVASTEARALEAIGDHWPDAVVIDVGMARLDAFELLDAVRAHERSIAIVAIGAHPTLRDRERALASGFKALFASPVDPGDLAGALADLLRGRSAEPSLPGH